MAPSRIRPSAGGSVNLGDNRGVVQRIAISLITCGLVLWAGCQPVANRHLPLPTNRPRPAVQTFHGAATTFTLPEPLAEAGRTGANRSLSCGRLPIRLAPCGQGRKLRLARSASRRRINQSVRHYIFEG